MIPNFVTLNGSPWDVLPPGIHWATLDEIRTTFATNPRRRALFSGLIKGLAALKAAGCSTAYLDGGYVSAKPSPKDFDACWDPTGVDKVKLDSVFFNMSNGRVAQKAKFSGEFFVSSLNCLDVGKTFLEFFQMDRFTGKPKGIIAISLTSDPLLLGKAQP